MWQTLLDLVFPRRSLTGERGRFITPAECRQLQGSPVVLTQTELQASGLTALDGVAAAAQYRHSPLLPRAIHTYKYRRIPALHTALAELLLDADFTADEDGVVLCPVPLHWTRQFSRGFNQSALLADALAEQRGYQVQHLLRRVRPTGHQARRNRADRLTAVQDAFVYVGDLPAPEKVILIDDLATTGATLEACATALKSAGVRYAAAWTVAHG